uniref:ATP synthase F0 subunit 8 n=1 Tax=Anabolia furcata TaxID=1875130 RepID=A0A872YN51_9NEOP|nr:ATP synthase F0 subunit 8 [Anabolia furcata]
MPQMMPLNWMFLYILTNLIFFTFMIYNYFNLNFFTNNYTTNLKPN